MSNMSYCRFHNTAIALAECERALQGIASEEDGPLSRDEYLSARHVVSTAFRILELLVDHAAEPVDFDDPGFEASVLASLAALQGEGA